MSPLPPPPPHMEHAIPPPPPGSVGPFFHGPGIPPSPLPGGPKLGETNNNSLEKDCMGKGDEEESVDGDAEGCKGESPRIQVDRAMAIRFALVEAETGDTVLIAGKGHESYQEQGDSRVRFSDFDCARKGLQARSAL